MSTIITAAVSGFIGAVAGGGIALVSQILSRRWQVKDALIQEKKIIYSELSSVGSRFIGDDVYNKINSDVGRALLICEPNLKPTLLKYILNIATVNKEDEAGNDTRSLIKENSKIAEELLVGMRKELQETGSVKSFKLYIN